MIYPERLPERCPKHKKKRMATTRYRGQEGTRQENKKLSASYYEESQTVSECIA